MEFIQKGFGQNKKKIGNFMINKDKFFEILEYLQEIDKFENDFRKLLNTTSRDTNFIYAAAFND